MSWVLPLLGYFVLCVLGPFLVVLLIFASINKSTGETASPRLIAILLFGVATIGACAGFAGGMSRVGVVGAIIPAMFTFLGGLAVYLFGVDNSKGAIASITSACFATALFMSYVFGSQLRNIGDEKRDLRAYCMSAYTNDKIIGDADTFAAFEKRLGNWCKHGTVWTLQ